MSSELDEVLARAIGQVGGPVGAGARFVGRLLPKDVAEERLEFPHPPGDVAAAVAGLLSAGEPVTLADPESAEGRSAHFGAGALHMNPAVVTVWLAPSGEAGTAVRVRGVAKEGLIKQHAGARAVQEFAAGLRALVAAFPPGAAPPAA